MYSDDEPGVGDDRRRPASRSASLSADLQELEGLDLQGLRARWSDRYGPAPKLRSAELLRLMLAWRMQAAAWGGLDGPVRRRLARQIAGGAAEDLPVGARLAREWKGIAEEVEVTAEGFLWRDQVFQSLSAVARAITGTRWNGPRFFGLRGGGPAT